MRLTATEYIANLASKSADMPYDGVIVAVYPETVTVRPVGQTRARSIRNVKIPSHIDYKTIKPGMPCKLDKSLSVPVLAAVFAAIESKGYSGIGTIVPTAPDITVSGIRDFNGNIVYFITCTVNDDDARFISSVEVWYNELNSTSGMSLAAKASNNGGNVFALTFATTNKNRLWFGAVAVSGLNKSEISQLN